MIHFQVVAEKEKTAREKAERRLFAARIVSLEVARPLSDHAFGYMRRLPLWDVAAGPDPD